MPSTLTKDNLNRQGVYFTHLTKELVHVFRMKKKPLSASEILKAFNKMNFFPNPSSLYRQLKRLSEVKMIDATIFSDGTKRYCMESEKDHHHHFECKKCGEVANIPFSHCKSLMKKITGELSRQKLTMTAHTITLEGFCAKCL